MEKRFYVCKHCGNMVGMIKNAGVPIICCGEPMAELTANTVEASQEKHLPVYTMEGGVLKVQVGCAEHPMLAEHYIEWIYVETEHGGQRKALNRATNRQQNLLLQAAINPLPFTLTATCTACGKQK